jgi:hypothetical protein
MGPLEQAGGIYLILLSAGIGIIINTVIIWLIVNVVLGSMGEGPFLKCLATSISLSVVGVLSLAFLFFPIPLVNIIIWLVVWYKLSKMMIDVWLDVGDKAARSILIIYIIASILLNLAVRELN